MRDREGRIKRSKKLQAGLEKELNFLDKKINVTGPDKWTLDKYINSILIKDRELPSGLLRDDYIALSRYADLDRRYVIFSFKQLVDELEAFSRLPAAYDDKFKQWYEFLKQNYNDADDNVLLRTANKFALKVKSELAVRNKTFTDLDHFRRQIIQSQLRERYLNLQDAFSSEGLKTIFPNDGVFLVTSNNFQYIAKADLATYIRIETVSGGTVKIERLGRGFNQPIHR
jgi:hypothetical protein